MISPVSHKIPYDNVISSAHGELTDKLAYFPNFNDLIYPLNFVVILNGYVYSFQEVSGIDGDFPYESIEDGGNPCQLYARKVSDVDGFTILNLKRGMPVRKSHVLTSAVNTLAAQAVALNNALARKNALVHAASIDPIVTLERGPADGMIQIFNRDFTKDVATFKFFSYGASKWSIGDLDATSGSIVYESIDLVCSGVRRVVNSNSTTPTSVNLSSSDSKVQTISYDYFDEYLADKEKKYEEWKKKVEEIKASREKEDEELKKSEEERKKRLDKWKEYMDKVAEIRKSQEKESEKSDNIEEEYEKRLEEWKNYVEKSGNKSEKNGKGEENQNNEEKNPEEK